MKSTSLPRKLPNSLGDTSVYDLFQAALPYLPFILLAEELVFRVIPFYFLSFKFGFFTGLVLHLIVHVWDRQTHRSSNRYALYFITIQTLVASVLACVYFRYGLWSSFLIHLFWDYLLIASLNIAKKRHERKFWNSKVWAKDLPTLPVIPSVAAFDYLPINSWKPTTLTF